MEIFKKEFMAFYREEGEIEPLPKLCLQYKDFSDWQNCLMVSGEIEKQGAYWQKQLEGEIEPLNLPTDYPRPSLQQFAGKRVNFGSEEYGEGLNRLALNTGSTLYMVLFAIFNLFLAKLSNQEDIFVGVPVAGRRHPDLENIIGMFVNTLAVRTDTSGRQGFMEFLAKIKENLLKAFENQDYQYEELVENLDIKRDLSRNPLFDAVFVLQNMGAQSVEIPGLTLIPREYESETSKFDLTLQCIEDGESLLFTFEYSTMLFREAAIRRFIHYFKNIISGILKNPERKLSEIKIISEAEKEQVLVDFNNTASDYPEDKTIHTLFAEQVEERPDRTALAAQNALTYRELNERSDRLAHLLQSKGIRPDAIVGLMAERSLEMIVGILGILKAGGAYLPIDPGYPSERIDFMLKDSNAGILVSASSNGRQVSEDIEVIDLCRGEPLCSPGILLHHSSFIEKPNRSEHLAYVIYTSGTTGIPKGVLTTHFNVTRVVRNTNYIDITAEDRVLQLSNYAFDGSVFDIYGALLNGAVLVMMEEQKVPAVDRVSGLLKGGAISVFFVTTALFNTLVDLDISCFTGVRKVLFGGERVSVEHSGKALGYLGEGRVIHVYGPTETTVYATYYPLDAIDETAGTIPIGRPIANTCTYILDRNVRPVPLGVSGEIYIGGKGTARGYLNRPELTAEKFPSVSSVAKKLYKTGDLARQLPDGNIEFLGRIDHQVKIRGFRIELGEIEHYLLGHDDINEAVVIVTAHEQTDKYLCAYVVSDSELSISRLRDYLKNGLPGYMVPTYVIQLERIPLTANGKVDLKALPEPGAAIREPHEAPSDETEKTLAGIWAETLGIPVEKIGVNDDFFHIGGHSLKAAVVLAMIRKAFNVKMTLSQLFTHTTLRRLSEYIKKSAPAKHISLEAAEKKDYYPLAPAQKRLYILQQMEKDDMTYNMPVVVFLEGEPQSERLQKTFHRLTRRHESLRTSFQMVAGEPVQRIHEKVECEIQYFLATEDTEDTEFVRPFDLSEAPQFRVGLVKQEEKKYILMVDMHHIVSDGTSMGILIRELMGLYGGEELPALRLQYKDFSLWQVSGEGKKALEQQEQYWLKQFQGELPLVELPCDYPRPLKQNFAGSTLFFEMDSEKNRALKELAKEEEITLFMLLTALYSVLLWKLSGSEDIVVGTAAAGREDTETRHIMGMFVNTLAIRSHPSGDKTFSHFLTEIKEKTLEAFENQAYPFEDLIEKIAADRDTSRNPIFDTLFTLQNLDIPALEIPGLKLKPFDYDHPFSKFDLTLIGVEGTETLRFSFEYRTKLFKEETVKRFSEYFNELASVVTAEKDIKLKDMTISHSFDTAVSRKQEIEFGF